MTWFVLFSWLSSLSKRYKQCFVSDAFWPSLTICEVFLNVVGVSCTVLVVFCAVLLMFLLLCCNSVVT